MTDSEAMTFYFVIGLLLILGAITALWGGRVLAYAILGLGIATILAMAVIGSVKK